MDEKFLLSLSLFTIHVSPFTIHSLLQHFRKPRLEFSEEYSADGEGEEGDTGQIQKVTYGQHPACQDCVSVTEDHMVHGVELEYRQ